ncbi:hypothetical protein HZC07_01535 [Candidatus Micrarchaeota archaeon]|nr:hypothetical protein [Candidatus Micrarchaeota archaeon]
MVIAIGKKDQAHSVSDLVVQTVSQDAIKTTLQNHSVPFPLSVPPTEVRFLREAAASGNRDVFFSSMARYGVAEVAANSSFNQIRVATINLEIELYQPEVQNIFVRLNPYKNADFKMSAEIDESKKQFKEKGFENMDLKHQILYGLVLILDRIETLSKEKESLTGVKSVNTDLNLLSKNLSETDKRDFFAAALACGFSALDVFAAARDAFGSQSVVMASLSRTATEEMRERLNEMRDIYEKYKESGSKQDQLAYAKKCEDLRSLVGTLDSENARNAIERQSSDNDTLVAEIISKHIKLSADLHSGKLAGVMPISERRAA